MSKNRRHRQKLPSEPVELSIDRLGHDGRGIGYLDGKIAFVEGALTGERVSAKFLNRRPSFDELKAVEILHASSDRRLPRCSWAEICGGCSMQHVAPQVQLDLKQRTLFDQLQHTAGITEFEHLPPLQANHYSYRRKARLAVRHVHKKGDTLVGFREKNSSFITDMESCSVLEHDVSVLISPLRLLMSSLQGRASIPQIEVAVGETGPCDLPIEENNDDFTTPEGICQVALIVRHLEELSAPDQEQLLQFARDHALELYLQPSGQESVHKVWPADNNERLHYYLPEFALKMTFHPTDFTQVNAAINRLMVSAAVGMLNLQPEDQVLDLFCGLGNFTLPIAQRCAKVTGVEGSMAMVARGYENAALNALGNVDFHAADLCAADLSNNPEHSWATQKYSKILLDPPRSGALEIIPLLTQFGAEKIVYISCNPATLARDAAELGRHGYALLSAGIMDMFPHTSHVESIAEFVPMKKKRKKTPLLL